MKSRATCQGNNLLITNNHETTSWMFKRSLWNPDANTHRNCYIAKTMEAAMEEQHWVYVPSMGQRWMVKIQRIADGWSKPDTIARTKDNEMKHRLSVRINTNAPNFPWRDPEISRCHRGTQRSLSSKACSLSMRPKIAYGKSPPHNVFPLQKPSRFSKASRSFQGAVRGLHPMHNSFSSLTLCPIYMLSAVCGTDKQLAGNSGCPKHNNMVDKWPYRWITNHQMMFLKHVRPNSALIDLLSKGENPADFISVHLLQSYAQLFPGSDCPT